MRLFALPGLFAGKLHAILVPRLEGASDGTRLVRPFIRDDAELALWDRTFFQSLATPVEG